MGNAVGGANDRLVAPKGFPGEPNTGLESSLVELNADAAVGSDAVRTPGDCRAAVGHVPGFVENVVVGLAVSDLGFGGNKSPAESDVNSKVRSYAPIVLDEGAIHFVAPAGGGAEKRLIVGC